VPEKISLYHVAANIEDALDRWRSAERATFVGGATALQLDWDDDRGPDLLIDVSGLGRQQASERTECALELCGFATLERIRQDSLVRQVFPILAQALGCIASFGVRSIGTLAGNLCWRKGDLRPLLVAADATAVTSAGMMPLVDWIARPDSGDLLLRVLIPLPSSGLMFEKVGYRRLFSPSCVTIACVIGENHTRIAVGGGSNRTARLLKTECAFKHDHRLGREALMTLIAAEDALEADADVTALEKAEIVTNMLAGAIAQSQSQPWLGR
jgi:CO/xanthine dehydrogenase FAD-binding subunit